MHKTPDCPGRWIPIGTLSDPYRELCSECRATRRRITDDDEPPHTLRDYADEEDAKNEFVESSSEFPWGILVIVGLVIVVAAVGLMRAAGLI